MGNEQTKNEVATGVGIQSMDQQLQRESSPKASSLTVSH